MYPYYDRNLGQWKKGTWTKTIHNTARRGTSESLMEERLQTGANKCWKGLFEECSEDTEGAQQIQDQNWRSDVPAKWDMITSGIRHDSNVYGELAVDSPNSLLIGFYTLLSYSYCQRHIFLTLGSWKRKVGDQCPYYGVLHENRKEICVPFLLSKPTVFLILDILLQNTSVHIRTCVCCLLFWGKGHAHIVKNTGSRLGKRLLLKGISYTSQKPFLTDGSGYKRDCLLQEEFPSCTRYVRQVLFP